MSTHIPGASVWEQEIYDYVSNHVVSEGKILAEYQQLADDPVGSPAFRYLAGLIFADERRHHELYNDLAASIRQMAELRLEDEPIPSLRGLKADRERIRATTDRLLAAERADTDELKRLVKKLKTVSETTLWTLLLELMQDDNAKHIKILKFIRDRADDALT